MKKAGVFVLFFVILFIGVKAFGDITADDMIPVLKKVKAEVSAELAGIDKDLADAAKKFANMDHKSNEARKILSGVCKGRSYVFDCAIIDLNGKLSVMEPKGSQRYLGLDISFEPQVREVFKNKVPLVSEVFRGLDGKNYIDFEYPIINDKGEFLGSVSLLVSHDVLLKDIIAPLVQGQPCNVWVMQTDGMILYDPDPNQINKNIFTDTMFEPFNDLISFSKGVAETPSGAGSYDFYKKGFEDKTVVKKDAVWDTVSLYGREWRIIAMEIVEDKPASETVTKQ